MWHFCSMILNILILDYHQLQHDHATMIANCHSRQFIRLQKINCHHHDVLALGNFVYYIAELFLIMSFKRALFSIICRRRLLPRIAETRCEHEEKK